MPITLQQLFSRSIALLLIAVGAWPGSASNGVARLFEARGADPAVRRASRALRKNEYYVSIAGSDVTGDGSARNPWRTIQHADAALKLGPHGTIVHVSPGRYNGDIVTSHDGAAKRRIAYVSDTQYGATIDGFWQERGSYVDVIGFDLTNSSGASGFYFGVNSRQESRGNFTSLRHSRIHNAAFSCSMLQSSALGQYDLTHDVTYDGNIVNDVGAKGGCKGIPGTSSHGIYLQGYHNTVINNLISNVAGYGVHAYHNPCQNTIVNNTIFHNYLGGIMIAGAPDAPAGGPCSAGDDYNTVNNNLVIRNGYGCGVHNSPSAYPLAPIIFYNVGNASHNSANNNYLAGNWDSAGDANCINRPGLNNSIIATDGSGRRCDGHNCFQPALSGNIGTPVFANLLVDYRDDGSGNYRPRLASPAQGAGTTEKCGPAEREPCRAGIDFHRRMRILESGRDVGVYVFEAKDGTKPAQREQSR